jgi:pyruvate dehydrogenase E2 component (dihydrolipoamide acetyltransferase)
MATHELALPRTGLTMEEGKVLKWLVDIGARVSQGQPVVQVETDKAVVELEAPADGFLREVAVEADAIVPYGTVLARFTDTLHEGLTGGGGESTASPVSSPPMPASAPPAPAASAAGGPEFSTERGGVRASPAARRLAARRGVALETVEGSGPGGRILRRDVEEAVKAPSPAAAGRDVPGQGRLVPHSAMRRAIAQAMVQSWTTIPQFSVTRSADMTAVTALRTLLKDGFAEAGISVSDFIAQAVARTLTRHPLLNGRYVEQGGGGVVIPPHVGLGMAVALPDDGLLVPVIAEAEEKGLLSLAQARRELTAAALQNRLKPEWLTGGTFIVSNLGPFGVEQFEAICFPGQAAILALGAVRETPVAVGGQVVVQPRLTMTLTVDHRVADGAAAARFLADLVERLETREGWVL